LLFTTDKLLLNLTIQISAVPDPDKPNRILAVEIIRIEDGGRIAEDGRMKVGDQITEINGHQSSQVRRL
jgi:C-terminal processing protease CtpA/Prc